jgi:DNA primase small subunit
MGRIARLEGRSLPWAREQFARYYAREKIPPPVRLTRREFAMFPFSTETLMRRHAAFRTAEEFDRFLSGEVPRHVYYSSAYYHVPDHAKMAQKEWLGADLIFDLDADHLREAAGLTYEGQLELVKRKVRDLLTEFLFGDFGVAPESADLYFSGGRGYHVHVRDEAFLALNSPERRELVEYVMGAGFDPATAVDERREGARAPTDVSIGPGEGGLAPHRPGRVRSSKHLFPVDTPGWRGRTTRGVLALLLRWEHDDPKKVLAELEAAGASAGEARALVRRLLGDKKAGQIRETLSLDVFKGEVPELLLDLVLRQAAIEVQGETDAPVTTDIHRLIRLPGSLHGGTGLRVTALTLEELDGFDPLRDAVVPGPPGASVEVELAESVDHTVGGYRAHGAVGERLTLPTPAALFLTLRGESALPP